MIKKCDICGFNLDPDAHFCSGCNVELNVPEEADNVKVNPEKPQLDKKKTKSSPKQETPENEKVINWCVIQSWCNTYRMSYSRFFNLVVTLASGDMKLGFCHCSACNQGYREMIAMVADTTGKRKVTAQSREIVIKARGAKIDGFSLDISEFLRMVREKEDHNRAHEKEDPKPQLTNNGKIVIEIDPVVLETVILSTLSSEKGQEIIRSISKRKSKKENIAT
jgi:hypothetical protein